MECPGREEYEFENENIFCSYSSLVCVVFWSVQKSSQLAVINYLKVRLYTEPFHLKVNSILF